MIPEAQDEKSQFDNMTDASSTTGWDTPPTTICAADSWRNPRDIPCPEQTFQIIEKHSGRAITLVGDKVKLLGPKNTSHLDTHWHCVKQNGYFGFFNPQTGRYLGHKGPPEGVIHAAWCHLKEWELWTPREHRDGGYELLSPFYSHTLMVLVVGEGGDNLVRRRHGTTLWEFVRV